MLSQYADMAANVIGRRVFDMTNGWNGKPAAGEHVFVVTHQRETHAGTAPFTFVGVENAIAAAKEFAGDRDSVIETTYTRLVGRTTCSAPSARNPPFDR